MGKLRFILATFVVLQHIARVPYIGGHSVVFFFVISGYLMTLVMQTSYGDGPTGFSRFWANRFLRLFPVYWITILITIGLLLVFPATSGLHVAMRVPGTAVEWLQNISMLYLSPFPQTVLPRLSPATWALTTEIVFYLIISLGASRTLRRTLIWLGVSLVYTAFAVFAADSYRHIYGAIPGGSLPFSLGALIYFALNESERFRLGNPRAVLWGCMIGAATSTALRIAYRYFSGVDALAAPAMLCTIVFAAGAVLALLTVQPATRPGSGKFDKLLGDLSYPIYIAHWACAAIAATSFGLSASRPSVESVALFLVTYGLAIGYGLMLIRFVDPAIEHLRTQIRGQHAAPAGVGFKPL